jgi:hypothetical protein
MFSTGSTLFSCVQPLRPGRNPQQPDLSFILDGRGQFSPRCSYSAILVVMLSVKSSCMRWPCMGPSSSKVCQCGARGDLAGWFANTPARRRAMNKN